VSYAMFKQLQIEVEPLEAKTRYVACDVFFVHCVCQVSELTYTYGA